MRLLQTIADGLVLGGIYALSAAGFSLIFGVLHVINLSHGVIVLIGAYVALLISATFHVDPFVAMPLVMIVLFCFGYVYQRWLVQYAIEQSELGSMLLTFGVALMLQNVLIWLFSPDMRSITPSYAFNSLRLDGITFEPVRLAALFTSLLLLGCLAIILKFSPLGRVIRATAQQTLAARLCGVNVRHVFPLTLAVSAAFSGAAGIVIGIMLPFSPVDEAMWTLNAFFVVTLGGVNSPASAILGGRLLGVISTMTSQYVGLSQCGDVPDHAAGPP
jgi:branched-chain amino acid transport system permease protein